jgi:YVTN family beta-propeller protein
VSVIDTATNTVTATVRVGWKPTQVTVSPDGTRAYVTNAYSRSVSVIDTSTNTVVHTVRVGWTPTQMTVSPDGARAYVTNTSSNSVSVIDTTTNTVVHTVRVGWTPTRVAIDHDGNRAYVTNTNSNSVSVIDTTTNTVIDTIGVGWKPTQVAISPDGNRAYVTNAYSNSVSVIDTATNTVIDTIGVGWKPTRVAISPDGLVYVTNTYSRSVSVIDTATNTVVDTVGVGNGPVAVAVGSAASGSGPVYTPPSPPGTPDPITGAVTGALGWIDPDGDPLTITLTSAPAYGTVTFDSVAGTYDYVPNQAGRIRAGLGLTTEDSFTVDITQPGTTTRPVIYVANVNSNTISVIAANADQPAPAALTRVEPARQAGILGQAAAQAAAAPAALAEDGFSEQVTINGIQITPDQFVVGDPIPVAWMPSDVVLTASGVIPPRAYVSIFGSGIVQVIDTDPNSATYNTVIDTIPSVHGTGATWTALSPDGAHLYVVTSDATVSVIDTATKEVTDVPVAGPWAVAVTPEGNRVYATSTGTNTVSVIDTDPDNTATYNTVIAAIAVGNYPTGVTVSPDGTRAYVANGMSGTVSVFDTATNTVIGEPIAVGNGPFSVAVNPNESLARAYVVNYMDGTVSVIDTASNTVTGETIPVGSNPISAAVSPDGSLAYVTNYSGTVSVIDTSSDTVITTIVGPGSLLGMDVAPDGNHIYVVSPSGPPDQGTLAFISIEPAGAT